MKFIKGHKGYWLGKKRSAKMKKILSISAKRMKMELHSNWKGGIRKYRGYIMVRTHNHPYISKIGYIFLHRLIIEKQIRRYLLPKEVTHHLGKKEDNRPQKLMAFKNNSAHIRFHNNPCNVKPSEIIFDGRKLHK